MYYGDEKNADGHIVYHYDRWGVYSVIASLVKFGVNWSEEYPRYNISINDISLKTGGPFYTPYRTRAATDHDSHQSGLEVDIRLPQISEDTPRYPTGMTIDDPNYCDEKTTYMLMHIGLASKITGTGGNEVDRTPWMFSKKSDRELPEDDSWGEIPVESEFGVKRILFADEITMALAEVMILASDVDYEYGMIWFKYDRDHDDHIHFEYWDPDPYSDDDNYFDNKFDENHFNGIRSDL